MDSDLAGFAIVLLIMGITWAIYYHLNFGYKRSYISAEGTVIGLTEPTGNALLFIAPGLFMPSLYRTNIKKIVPQFEVEYRTMDGQTVRASSAEFFVKVAQACDAQYGKENVKAKMKQFNMRICSAQPPEYYALLRELTIGIKIPILYNPKDPSEVTVPRIY